MTEPKPSKPVEAIDWFRLVWDLIQHGQTLTSVAQTAGIPRTSLNDYMRGGQPMHWRGERMIDLWCVVCSKPRSELPMVQLSVMPRVVKAPGIAEKPGAFKELDSAWRG